MQVSTCHDHWQQPLTPEAISIQHPEPLQVSPCGNIVWIPNTIESQTVCLKTLGLAQSISLLRIVLEVSCLVPQILHILLDIVSMLFPGLAHDRHCAPSLLELLLHRLLGLRWRRGGSSSMTPTESNQNQHYQNTVNQHKVFHGFCPVARFVGSPTKLQTVCFETLGLAQPISFLRIDCARSVVSCWRAPATP